jgi:hypothetical protein
VANGAAMLYLARRFGIGVGVDGGHSTSSLTHHTTDSAGGGVNFEAWLSRQVGIKLGYGFEWSQLTGARIATQSNWASTFSLSLFARPN